MMNSLNHRKRDLRKTLLCTRETMTASARGAAEAVMMDVLRLKAREQCWQSVAVFLPWRAEPDLTALWAQWSLQGMALALPTVVQADAPLSMRAWRPGDVLSQDAMGLMAPLGAPQLDCQVWLIPCVGIDPQGGRLGAGKGFYDRTIAAIRESRLLDASAQHGDMPKLIGVSFESARTTEAFREPHDLMLQACVTETGWHEFQEAV